jgi:hypothetical protein
VIEVHADNRFTFGRPLQGKAAVAPASYVHKGYNISKSSCSKIVEGPFSVRVNITSNVNSRPRAVQKNEVA